MRPSDLISSEYQAEQARLHAAGNYGTASLQWGELVTRMLDATKSDSLLDYGCGSMRNLTKVLNPEREVRYIGYDPAVQEFSHKEPAHFVACIDVLEHIEPGMLENVLDDLLMLTERWAFITVHTGPAKKTLSDGRNAHLIQKSADWWLPRLMQRFELRKFDWNPSGFAVFMKARS